MMSANWRLRILSSAAVCWLLFSDSAGAMTLEMTLAPNVPQVPLVESLRPNLAHGADRRRQHRRCRSRDRRQSEAVGGDQRVASHHLVGALARSSANALNVSWISVG